MTTLMQADAQLRAQRQASANDRLADWRTPLPRSFWYVAGLAQDFSRTPKERTLLGQSLVFYRSEAGQPVALANRCPHRSYPLAHGQLEGDVLRCGYHGLAFAPNGRCVDIPSQDKVPDSVCTRSYPAVEQGPFVWIWMGDDPEGADPALLPRTDWLASPDWRFVSSYLELQSNYVYLHENLLDLTHFTYLHPTTLGTPEYARTPFDVELKGQTVRVSRFVPECDVPPIYARTGITGKMSRHTVSEFLTPAMHHASAVMRDLAAPAGQPYAPTIYITHFVTPETSTKTHYWFAFARNFALDSDEVDDYMRDNALKAFNEDRFALEEVARLYQQEPAASALEIHIKSDGAGIAARRILRQLGEQA